MLTILCQVQAVLVTNGGGVIPYQLAHPRSLVSSHTPPWYSKCTLFYISAGNVVPDQTSCMYILIRNNVFRLWHEFTLRQMRPIRCQMTFTMFELWTQQQRLMYDKNMSIHADIVAPESRYGDIIYHRQTRGWRCSWSVCDDTCADRGLRWQHVS